MITNRGFSRIMTYRVMFPGFVFFFSSRRPARRFWRGWFRFRFRGAATTATTTATDFNFGVITGQLRQCNSAHYEEDNNSSYGHHIEISMLLRYLFDIALYTGEINPLLLVKINIVIFIQLCYYSFLKISSFM